MASWMVLLDMVQGGDRHRHALTHTYTHTHRHALTQTLFLPILWTKGPRWWVNNSDSVLAGRTGLPVPGPDLLPFWLRGSAWLRARAQWPRIEIRWQHLGGTPLWSLLPDTHRRVHGSAHTHTHTHTFRNTQSMHKLCTHANTHRHYVCILHTHTHTHTQLSKMGQ